MSTPVVPPLSVKSFLPRSGLAELPPDLTAEMEAILKAAGSESPGMPFSQAIKNAFNFARGGATLLNRATGGRAAGQLLSDAADRILVVLFQAAAKRASLSVSEALSLLAMGSYGRRELALYSDIDVLLLHAPGISAEKLELFAGYLLRPLWDAGLHVGHAVRTPDECLRAMADATEDHNAIETATSVMEARFVAGDRVMAEAFFSQDLPDFFKQHGRAFVDAKFEETIARWKGCPVYRTQPNLKESPGALRDYQLALWIDRASQLSGHLPRLNNRPLVSDAAIDEAGAGYEKLLTFRVSLHSLCGRKQDVLDQSMQPAVAQDLSYESADDLRPAERLLRDYFRAATAVHRLAQTVTRRYLEERAVATRDIERLRRRKLDADFTRVGDYVYASHADVFRSMGVFPMGEAATHGPEANATND
jgi:[protein-PII] uridylyltransferase